MKKFISTITLLVLLLLSCSQDYTVINNNDDNLIQEKTNSGSITITINTTTKREIANASDETLSKTNLIDSLLRFLRVIPKEDINSVTVKVDGYGIPTTIESNIVIANGTGTGTISNIPIGKNRIISVIAKDGSTNLIPGAVLRTSIDIIAGTNTASIKWDTTPRGNIYYNLLQSDIANSTTYSRDVTSDALEAFIQSVIVDNSITHQSLVNAEKIASDIVANSGTLPVSTAGYKIATGSVKFTISDFTSGTVSAFATDPSSQIVSITANGVFTIANVYPGSDWRLLFTVDGSSGNIYTIGDVTSDVTTDIGEISLSTKVTLVDLPTATTYSTSIDITVSGTNIVSYKYSLDGGAWSAETPIATHITASSLSLGAHSIGVYGKDSFGNWQSVANATTHNWTIEETTTTTTTTIIYTITYNLNGGNNDHGNPSSYTINTPTISLGSPTQTGYNFGGWYDNENFTGTAITEITQGSTGNKEFWVKWIINTDYITVRKLSDPFTETPCVVNMLFGLNDIQGNILSGIYDATRYNLKENSMPLAYAESVYRIKERNLFTVEQKTVIMVDISNSIGTSNLTIYKNALKSIVNNMNSDQYLCIYTFDGTVTLIQDFTNNQSTLLSVIDSISLGFMSTNLYEAVYNGLDKFTNSFSNKKVTISNMIVLTDGEDSSGVKTLSDVITKRGDKSIITVGIGGSTAPEILEQIGNMGYYSSADFTVLQTELDKIRAFVTETYENVCWLKYYSPKRSGEHTIELSIVDNINTGDTSKISGTFSATSPQFYDVMPGIYINDSYSKQSGDTSFTFLDSDTSKTMQINSHYASKEPVYTFEFSVADSYTVTEDTEAEKKTYILTRKLGGNVTMTVRDTANGFEKSFSIMGTSTYTVFFNTNGGSSINELYVMPNKKILKPVDPIKDGFEFIIWCKNSDLIVEWNFNTDTVIENTTLYAKFLPLHIVSFDTNGGSEVSEQLVCEGLLVTRPESPLKVNYYFVGWYKDSDLTLKWEFNTDSVTEDMFLYAKYMNDPGYNLHDTGPAGGIIFYIESGDTGAVGWKYLEAAPIETEWTSKVWGGYSTTVTGADGTAIGTGIQNTIDIVTQFGNNEPYQNKTDYAAKLCSDLVYGGCDDWFLPSIDELNQVYANLKTQGFGEFSNSIYWSSSEAPDRLSYQNALFQNYNSGGQDYGSKKSTYDEATGSIRIRAIRAF